MSFEGHYQRFGVAIIEWALERPDLRSMGRAFEIGKRAANKMAASRVVPADLADWLETHPVLIEIAGRLLGDDAQLVRIQMATKPEKPHWFVPWHQNRTIALSAKSSTPGFRNWTRRAGYWQVEPPDDLLSQMVDLQIYLDACGENDGPIEVLPGTHTFGRLGRSAIGTVASTLAPQVCLADAGDILAMSPLTVHRTRRARSEGGRRVLNLSFAAQGALPANLAWASLMPDVDRV